MKTSLTLAQRKAPLHHYTTALAAIQTTLRANLASTHVHNDATTVPLPSAPAITAHNEPEQRQAPLITAMNGQLIPSVYPDTGKSITFSPCHWTAHKTFSCGHSSSGQTACPYIVCLHPPHHPQITVYSRLDYECNACQRRWHFGEMNKMEKQIREKTTLLNRAKRVRKADRDEERICALLAEIAELRGMKKAMKELIDAMVPLEA